LGSPFWLGFRRCWSKWASVLVVVKPETVVSWHRAGFRGYWRFLSRRGPGRPKITSELRDLIRSMAAENPTWGAPRIHGELLKLRFEISESTVSRYLAQGTSPPDSNQRWLTFLKNHREAIAVMDFFTVPTATFRVVPPSRQLIARFSFAEGGIAFVCPCGRVQNRYNLSVPAMLLRAFGSPTVPQNQRDRLTSSAWQS